MTFGRDRYAGATYVGTLAHTAPTVSSVAVARPSGPTITVSWTYFQSASVPQDRYRVEVGNAALSTTYYDSGFLTGTDAALVIDAVAEGIPTNTAPNELGVRVTVRSADGPIYQAISGIVSFDIFWGTVVVTIISPADGSSTPTVTDGTTLEVDYTVVGTAVSISARLLAGDSDFVFADTGVTPAAGGTLDVLYSLVSGTHYRIELTVWNANGVESEPALNSFWYFATVPSTITPLDSVGRIYEVGINGVGYMLFDANADVAGDVRTELLRRTRTVQDLTPPRLATSQTPFTEAIERYTFFGQSDFRGGTAQRDADRETSDPTRFFDSMGVNPFEPHEVSLLRDTVLQASSAHTTPLAVAAGEKAIVQADADTLRVLDDPGGSPADVDLTTDGVTPVTGILGLASDGAQWYAACGTDGILQGLDSDPGAVWSAVEAQVVAWVGQRICCAYSSNATTPNVFSTLNGSGAEEVGGGRITLPIGWTISEITGGGGQIWFAAYNDNRGVIYKWDLTAAVPSVAWELPIDQLPIALYWYQGQVFVRVRVVTALTGEDRALIYAATPDSTGNLAPALVCQLEDGENSFGTFGANDRFVFFSWSGGSLGAIDLSTGGYCRWITAGASDRIVSIFEWRGRTMFSVAGSGLWAEDPDNYVEEGWLKTSTHDGASGVDKVWDRVQMRFLPLPVGVSIGLEASYDGGNSYAAVDGWSAYGAGASAATRDIGRRSQSASLRIFLATDDTTVTPTITVWQLQCHPIGKADLVVELPIDCGDSVSDLNGRALNENGSGAGSERARLLENLQGSRVSVQDVDWAETGITEIFEVVMVKRVPVPGVVKEKAAGQSRLLEVVILTLRKSFR